MFNLLMLTILYFMKLYDISKNSSGAGGKEENRLQDYSGRVTKLIIGCWK